MYRLTTVRFAAVLSCTLLMAAAPYAFGQAAPDPQTPSASPSAADAPVKKAEQPVRKRKMSYGFRLRYFPSHTLSPIANGNVDTITEATDAYPREWWDFGTTNHSAKVAIGGLVEYQLNRNTTITADFTVQGLQYEKVTNVWWGYDDPDTDADERTHMSLIQRNKVTMWDLPILIHHRGLISADRSPLLNKLWLSGGIAGRTLTNVRTQTQTTYEEGGTGYDEKRAMPARRTVAGVVGGIGYRIVDDFNIKVMPEIRCTYWTANMYGSDSTKSPRLQAEVSLTFAF
jgi:hypothetical protein